PDRAAARPSTCARALARAAADAYVDLLVLPLVNRQRPALPLGHEVDAAARRLGLETRDAKRRACVEAQAAVDAGREVVVGQTRERNCQTTNLPGFKTPPGSNACFRRRWTSSVDGTAPHAPTSRVKSSGAARRARVPPAPSTVDLISRTELASVATDQCAIPMPGEAHHSAPEGNVPRTRRSSDRGTATRAQRSGARPPCSAHPVSYSDPQPSALTTRLTASGLPV